MGHALAGEQELEEMQSFVTKFENVDDDDDATSQGLGDLLDDFVLSATAVRFLAIHITKDAELHAVSLWYVSTVHSMHSGCTTGASAILLLSDNLDLSHGSRQISDFGSRRGALEKLRHPKS